MADADPDRILAARLQGHGEAYAKWRELTGAEHDAAAGELSELAAGRSDPWLMSRASWRDSATVSLMSRWPGQAAGLCRAAGADPEAIAAWIAEGRRRRKLRTCHRSQAACMCDVQKVQAWGQPATCRPAIESKAGRVPPARTYCRILALTLSDYLFTEGNINAAALSHIGALGTRPDTAMIHGGPHV